ncbi:MAG: cation diffusion facilitator family transporter [Desulfovibrio sp.]|nr:cation diffusion facilitator family transporter [Desulfovibrio sp.]
MVESQEAGAEKNRAALTSLWAAFALTAVKLVVGLQTNSLGILSEALHSGLDLVAAAITLAAVRIASKPADARHPYGHGKIENLSALAETLLLFLTCFWVVYEGVQRLMAGDTPVTPSLWGVGVMALSIIIDVNRVRILRRVAKKYKSQALEADALHFSTDILSSAVVLVGVLAVWVASALNLPAPLHEILVQADTVAALLVALIIFRASIRMAMQAVDTLMDSGSTRERSAIITAVTEIQGITDVRDVRLRSSGPISFVDLTVGVEPGIKVSEGHRLAHEAEQAVAQILEGADVTVHVEPHSADENSHCDPFAMVQHTAASHGFAVHNVHILRSPESCYIELHIELPGGMPFVQAYKRVKDFEDALHTSIPGVEVVSHLEPEGAACALAYGASVSLTYAEMAWREIEATVAKEPLVTAPHKFSVYDLPEQGVCISFHCDVDPVLNVEEAHTICMRLEKQLRMSIPQLGRIIIHMEPGNKTQA